MKRIGFVVRFPSGDEMLVPPAGLEPARPFRIKRF